MKIIEQPVKLKDIWEQRESDFDDMLKIVVDIEKEILAIDAQMHADLETLLIENGSMQRHLWGANVYPAKTGDEFIEYTSFINIRPRDNNRDMEVKDAHIRKTIEHITRSLLTR